MIEFSITDTFLQQYDNFGGHQCTWDEPTLRLFPLFCHDVLWVLMGHVTIHLKYCRSACIWQMGWLSNSGINGVSRILIYNSFGSLIRYESRNDPWYPTMYLFAMGTGEACVWYCVCWFAQTSTDIHLQFSNCKRVNNKYMWPYISAQPFRYIAKLNVLCIYWFFNRYWSNTSFNKSRFENA